MNAVAQAPPNDTRKAGYLVDGLTGRRKDYFFRVRSRRLTRIHELELAIADGVATESDLLELSDLRYGVECEAAPATIIDWKRK